MSEMYSLFEMAMTDNNIFFKELEEVENLAVKLEDSQTNQERNIHKILNDLP